MMRSITSAIQVLHLGIDVQPLEIQITVTDSSNPDTIRSAPITSSHGEISYARSITAIRRRGSSGIHVSSHFLEIGPSLGKLKP